MSGSAECGSERSVGGGRDSSKLTTLLSKLITLLSKREGRFRMQLSVLSKKIMQASKIVSIGLREIIQTYARRWMEYVASQDLIRQMVAQLSFRTRMPCSRFVDAFCLIELAS